MCASYEARFNVRQLVELFGKAQVPLDESHLPNVEDVDEVKPTDSALVAGARNGPARLAMLRFGFPPPRPKARPVVNLRSEGRTFENRDRTGRCLAIMSGFYEFTGERYPKTRWIFRDATLPILALAGVWRAGDGEGPGSFALLTAEPGPDIAPYHDRGVIPAPIDRWADWLTSDTFPADLIAPAPPGSLLVSPAPRPGKA